MNRDFENNLDPEVIDADERAVSRIIGGLKHVEAPEDFERRVMARISEASPDRRSPFAVPSWAYAVPLVLVLLIATFLVLRSPDQAVRQGTAADVEPVRNIAFQSTPAKQDDAPAVETVDGQPQKPAPAGARQRPETPAAARNTNKGGSYDAALPQQNPPRPAGLADPSSAASANRNDAITSASIPVTDVLLQIGIHAEFNGGWRVSRVLSNSIAERSGIMAGDVVVGLDSHELSSNTDLQGSGSVNTVRVRRAGKVISLRLK